MLAVVTMMRTAGAYQPRFRVQVNALSTLVPLRVIVGENDSRDDTKALLADWQSEGSYSITVLDCGDGSEHFGSVDVEDRWRSIAGVMNRVLDEVDDEDNHVLYVDADLIWEPEMIVRLIDRVNQTDDVDVVAPLAWHHSGRPFDLWGTRRHGQRIQAIPPWFEGVTPHGMVEVESVACLNVMDAHWARVARFGETNANVGWHDEMRAKGAHIWVDFDERVVHP